MNFETISTMVWSKTRCIKNMVWNVRSKHDPNFAHGANNTKRGLDFGEDSIIENSIG